MDNFAPKYVLIQNYIFDKISSGELGIGNKIPSESELSDMFKVSRVTSNKAISELSMMGIVERVKGKGTFVKSINTEFKDMSHILSKSFKISSEASELHYHKLEKIEFIKANEDIAKKLDLKLGEKVCKVVRVMFHSGEAMAIDYSYISAQMCNDKLPDANEISNYYIHEYLRIFLNQKPKYLHIHIDAKIPDSFEIKILSANAKKPLIIWDTNIIDEDNKTIAVTTTIAKADKYKPFINFEL